MTPEEAITLRSLARQEQLERANFRLAVEIEAVKKENSQLRALLAKLAPDEQTQNQERSPDA